MSQSLDNKLKNIADEIIKLSISDATKLVSMLCENLNISISDIMSSNSSSNNSKISENSDKPKSYKIKIVSYTEKASVKAELIKIIAKKNSIQLIAAKKIVESVPIQISDNCDENTKNNIVSLFDKIKQEIKMEIQES